jgi:hypothetical protein
MLKAAEATVKTWEFDMPRDLYRSEWRYDTEFQYRLSDEKVDRQPKLTVTVESFHHIQITRDAIKAIVQY